LTIRTVDHDPKTSTQTKGDLINRITLPNQDITAEPAVAPTQV
jgi:hypothetical protein